MFLTMLYISAALLGIAFIGLGVGVFFSKKKAFPNTSVGGNKALRKQGVYCAKTEQAIIDKNYKVKNTQIDCSSCGL